GNHSSVLGEMAEDRAKSVLGAPQGHGELGNRHRRYWRKSVEHCELGTGRQIGRALEPEVLWTDRLENAFTHKGSKCSAGFIRVHAHHVPGHSDADMLVPARDGKECVLAPSEIATDCVSRPSAVCLRVGSVPAELDRHAVG